MTHATRERLILAAERLFAERGIGGVSLREIGTAAGQRNNSAAQYHFDTKQGLVDAVYEFRMHPINERRLALVLQIEREHRTNEVRALVEALVHPFAESLRPGSYYARFQAQVWADGGAHAQLLAYELKGMEGVRRLMAWLESCLTDVPAPVRAARLLLMGRFMIFALADYERELTADAGVPPLAAVVANMVDMMVAMVIAPISPATARELPNIPS